MMHFGLVWTYINTGAPDGHARTFPQGFPTGVKD